MDIVLDGIPMQYNQDFTILDRGPKTNVTWQWEYYQKTGMDNKEHTFAAIDSCDPSAPPTSGTGTAFKLAL